MKVSYLTTFNDLGLAEPLLRALAAEGYTNPTPIQAKAIPGVMAGSDLLGIAQTGTGKTAAFALPILHRLAADLRPAPRKGCRVLVLSPTRELASQIAESFRTYGRHFGFTVATIFGGVGHRPQSQALARGVDVLVATPGRLIDHIQERNAVLASTEILVLDEADQMLDLGFLPAIRRIVATLSHKRQNLFFSATMPSEIGKLADELLKSPIKVSVAPVATTAERVAQRVIHVEAKRKRGLLVELLKDGTMARTLVFTRTKRGADKVAEHLDKNAIAVAAIHGNKSQRQREAALADFKADRIRVLVATDIAARGIDVDLVTHVVNYEMPDVPESYVHRIGRTARAGASGIAISLVDSEERGQLRDIERLTRQTIPSEDRRDAAAAAALPAEPAVKRGPRGGGRGEGRGSRDGQGQGRGQGRPPRRDARSSDTRGSDGHRGADAERGDRSPRATEERTARGPDARPASTRPREDRPDRPARQDRPDRGDRNDRRDAPRSSAGDRGPRREAGNASGGARGPRDGEPRRGDDVGISGVKFLAPARREQGAARAPAPAGQPRGLGRAR